MIRKIAFVAVAFAVSSAVQASQPIVFCTTLILATFDATDPSCDPKITREYGTDILRNCTKPVNVYAGSTRYMYNCDEVAAQNLSVIDYVSNPPVKVPLQVCLVVLKRLGEKQSVDARSRKGAPIPPQVTGQRTPSTD